MARAYQDRRRTRGLPESRLKKDREKENEEEADGKKEGSGPKAFFKDLAVDFLVAGGIMLLILLVLFMVTGQWPPLVVVESNSMMHGTDSHLGVIDTGDMVLVKKVSERSDVISWVQGSKEGYRTYSTYGNVIIYHKDGDNSVTPVIHRAVVWIEYNSTGLNMSEYKTTGQMRYLGSYDVPSMGQFGIRDSFIIENYPVYGPDGKTGEAPLTINVKTILTAFGNRDVVPHSGFITKGDWNQYPDQEGLQHNNHLVTPVKTGWIVGRAMGEIPWYGLIKLTTGDRSAFSNAPHSSKTGLIVSAAMLLGLLLLIELLGPKVSVMVKERIRGKREDEEENNGKEEKGKPGKDMGPGRSARGYHRDGGKRNTPYNRSGGKRADRREPTDSRSTTKRRGNER